MARFFGLILILLIAVSSFAQNITAINATPNPARSGDSCHGTVTISVPAGPGGRSIGLSCDNAVATVPATVTIPEGQTQGNFSFTVHNGGYTKLSSTITASTNILERSVTVVVLPANNSGFVGQHVPTTMSTNKTYAVDVEFVNVGLTTWDSATHHYKIQSCNPVDNTTWGVNRLRMNDATVAPGNIEFFSGTVTAPATPGVYNFQWRCVQDDIYDPFGQVSNNVAITVTASTDDAQFISETGVPSLVFPGAPFSPVFTFKNTGGSTWTGAAGYALQSRSPYLNTTWGVNSVPVPITVAPQNILSISPACTAPTTPGTYSFAWFMVHGSGFGQLPTAVNITVLPPDSSQFISQAVPSTVNAGATFIPQIAFKNTGVSTWTTTGKFWLVTQGPFLNSTWGLSRCPLPGGAAVARGVTANFLPHLTAPLTPGTYFFQWQVSKNDVVFGQRCTGVTIQVNGVANAEDAQYISSTVPVLATAGQHYIAQVTFKNIGTANWPLNTAVGIYPQPDNSWGLNYLKTKSIINLGNSKTYTIDLLAPYIAGTHNIQFRMRDLNTNTWFGQTSPIVSVSVSPSDFAQAPWPGGRGGHFRMTGRGYGSGATGAILWSFTGPDYFENSPTIDADGTVYAPCNDGHLYAFNGATGALKWSQFFSEKFGGTTPVIGANGTIYIGSAGGHMYALDSATGNQKWSYAITGFSNWVSSEPCLSNGTLYFTSGNTHVFALDATTGALKWTTASVFSSIQSGIAIGSDGTLYFGSNNNKLVALDPATGAVLWTVTLGANMNSVPAIALDGTIYMGTYDNKMYAIDPGTHTVKWSFTTGGLISCSSVAIGADGTVFFGSEDRNVYALDGATGALKWSHTTGGLVDTSPCIASDGTVYVASGDGKLYAFNPDSGVVNFSVVVGGSIISNPAIGADGHIIVATTTSIGSSRVVAVH